MKTLLIVFAILALLGMIMFILIHEHKQTNEETSKPDSDATKVETVVPESTDTSENVEEPEVVIPERCKPQEDPVDNLPNKYFFNIHKYTTARNRTIYCVVCSALIKGHNYRTIVRNSFYPYMGSYTKTLCSKIVSKYSDTMTVEEFLKTGSNKFDRVGKIVDSLPYIY